MSSMRATLKSAPSLSRARTMARTSRHQRLGAAQRLDHVVSAGGEQRHAARPLAQVGEELRLRRAIETELPHVADDADDGPRRQVAADVDHLPDRIAPGELAARQRLVDEEHAGLAGAVPGRETASGHHPHAHRLDVLAADETGVLAVGLAAPRGVGARPQAAGRVTQGHHRQLVGVAGGDDARHRAQALDHRLGERQQTRVGIGAASAAPPGT